MIVQPRKLWHTVRYLHLGQIYGRIAFRLFRPAPDLAPAPTLRVRYGNFQLPARRLPSLIGSDVFFFLNETGSLANHGWDDPGKAKLWRYNQHYFDDLNSTDALQRTAWHLCLLSDWINKNVPGKGSGWEPYPTSLRIVNWIKWVLAGNELSNLALDSLAIQARWLVRRLEYHLLGNHLFANAKALIFAGCFFSGKEAAVWLKTGLDILEKEIPEQILADGGQFERSTMYHALAVEDMLDLLNVLGQLVRSPDEHSNSLLKPIVEAQEAIEQRLPPMLRWMNIMRHPDGEIAFFNDAAFGIAPSCDELLQYAARLGIEPGYLSENQAMVLQQSGYVRLSNPLACLLFDAAPIGPDYVPGHAHADTLSIELSLFGKRVFVNSGTSEYGVSTERHRQRGTAAHNTVEINNENSSEVWSGFRVARRAYPYAQRLETDDEIQVYSAWHSGYQRLSPPVSVGRRLQLQPGSLLIEDMIEGPFKSAVSRFHCHPTVTVTRISAARLQLTLPGGQIVLLQVEGDADVSIQPVTWHPRFGVTEPNQCIVISMLANKLITQLEWSQS